MSGLHGSFGSGCERGTGAVRWVRVGLLAALLAVPAAAQVTPKPAPSPTTSGPTGPCANVTEAQCLSKGFSESACGKACKSLLEKSFKQFYSGLATPTPQPHIYRALCQPDPKTLRPGKETAYTPRTPILTGGGTGFVGKGHAQRTQLATKSVNPQNAHRNIAWDTNGQQITSCDEYVYEKFYDWNRYLDAISVCKTAACVWDVAQRTNTPGLRRTLVNKAGAPLSRQIALRTGTFPKNEFFARGNEFFKWLPGTPPPEPLPADLADALKAGSQYYAVGATGGKEYFKDEWALHGAILLRNKHRSAEEVDEIARRKRAFRELVARHDALLSATKTQKLAPGSMDRLLEAGSIAALRRSMTSDFGRWANAPFESITTLTTGLSTAQQAQLFDPGIAASKQMAMSQPPGAQACPPGTQLAHICASPGHGDSVFVQLGKVRCALRGIIKDEWARKTRGSGGCLDLTSPECDSDVESFASTFASNERYATEEEVAYLECKKWGAGVTAASLAGFEKTMADNKAKVGEVLRNVPEASGSAASQRRFGQELSGGEQWGDRSSWSASYNYRMGWEARAATKKMPDGSTNICQLQGRAAGYFKASITTPLDEDLPKTSATWRDLVEADAWLRVNFDAAGNPDKKGRGFGKLRVLGTDVLNTGEQTVNLTHAFKHGVKNDAKSPKVGFSTFIGPIPINASAWAEFVYGGSLDAETDMPNADGCDAVFKAQAKFTPTLDANAVVKVSAGIEGILSVGIRGDISLIDIGIPLDSTLRLVANNKNQAITTLGLRVDANANMEVSTLDGKIRLIIDYVFDTYKKTLFQWRGLGPYNVPLIQPIGYTVPIIAFGSGS